MTSVRTYARYAAAWAVALAAWILVIGAAAESVGFGCTPAQSAVWSQIEQTVLTDVENGSALSAIEAAVIAIYPAAATVAGLVDEIITEAIQLLEDTGAFGDAGTGYAEQVKVQAAGKVAAARAVK